MTAAEHIAAEAIQRADDLAEMRSRVEMRLLVLASEIGVRLRQTRCRRGMSLDDLALRAGIPAARIARIERAHALRGPDPAEAEALARVLRVTPAWLCWGVT